MLSGKATYTNFIVFGLIRPWLKPTIYYTPGEHTNHYIMGVVFMVIGIKTTKKKPTVL
jgi:hypothetical protein